MKAIIFDIDGTLTNTTEVDDKCFKNAFKDIFEVDISNQSWDCIENVTDFGITEEIVHKQLGRLPTINEYQKMISRFVELLNNELKYDKSQFDEIDGATQFLRFISQKSNIAIGIATGGWKKSANLKLKAIGVNSESYAFSNSNDFKKREDILLETMRQLNAKNHFKEIVYFGDGIWDYKTCKILGIKFVGIDNKRNNKLINAGAEIVFKNFSNPLQILKHLNIE